MTGKPKTHGQYMTDKPIWQASDLTAARYKGEIEFQDNQGEYHDFQVLATPEKLVFGGSTNNSFLESGYITRAADESLDETMSELLSDLETYYNDGPNYCTRIVCNERM